MNSLVIAAVAIVLFWLGYQFYSRTFAKIWDIDTSRQTPAVKYNDGVDYVPAKHWTILFGHHFASIAGAAPVIGPIIALSLWGWFPALLWVVLGTILFGGIHDFGSLMVSLRSDGTSIAEGSVDDTKEVRIEVDGLTTSTVRVLTMGGWFDGR